MNYTRIDTQSLDPNPYQTRLSVTHASVTLLADDIELNGLQQPIAARPHPTVPGRYQIRVGHRRAAAFELLASRHPKQAEWHQVPAVVEDATDRQMADQVIAENAQREDLTAIEKANALKRYIDEFQVSQVEAAQRFNLQSQSAVSNLLRLLQLPASIQDMVQDGRLAERFARQLIPVAKIDPKFADKAAKDICGAEDPDDILHDRLYKLVRDHGGRWMRNENWPPTWPTPAQDISAEIAGKAGPRTIPACKGCEFHLRLGNPVCLNGTCFEAKTRAWALHEAKRISAKIGIPLSVPGEKSYAACRGYPDYRQREILRNLVERKAAYLRLEPVDAEDYSFNEILGSVWVTLRVADQDAYKRDVEADKGSQSDRATSSDSDKHRIVRRKQCKALVQHAAPAFMPLIPDTLMFDAFGDLVTGDGAWRSQYRAADVASRRRLVAERLVDHASEQQQSWDPNPGRARTKIAEVAAALKLKLPAGWDDLEDKPAMKAKPKAGQAKTKKSK